MTTITESQWVNYFGFQRFPFDRPEAGNEEFARPDFLASCFVEPKSFERVFGQADAPVTSILFAARGTGKTACRVMMDYYCQNGLARLSNPKPEEPNYVLSVPHVRLDHVREIARLSSPQGENPRIRVEHHVEEIMRQAIPVFVDMIAKNPSFVDRVKKLSRSDFEDLSLYIIYYSGYLSSNQQEFLAKLGIDMPPMDEPMKGLAGQSTTGHRPSPWSGVLYKQRLEASPLQHLEQWSKLMPKIGICATYVLIDGVDELMESAGDPNYAHSLIRPLLTHLRLMDETHHLALKFFLPSDLEPLILSDPAFRRDRGFVLQRIEWRKEDLINILRERLNSLRRPDYQIRDRTAVGFDALCVPELRGKKIEEDIASLVDGNPRRLMNFCALMVATHCSRDVPLTQNDPYELSKQDFELARQVFNVDSDISYEIISSQRLDISSLIAQGESEMLEFKSSMRYDYKRNTINKEELGLVIAKTVAGFMNHAGGILIIGVDDKGQILGIENDIETLTKKSLDGFQLAFKDIVRSFLGLEHLVHLHLFFDTLEGHSVCAVQMERSPIPVYVKNGNDNEFYVRMLNSTIKLGLPETVNYIRSQWG